MNSAALSRGIRSLLRDRRLNADRVKPSIVVLAGPTAVGKSEVAIELALRLDAEILSVDSMQVYRGLDIGTAKPSVEERLQVPHHLLDVVDVRQPFDVAQFVALAERTLQEIAARGKSAILVGGTGLYLKALLEGIGSAPPADPELRAVLAQVPLPELLAELESKDPELYRTIDRRNPRRVIRAVEVIRLTGQPYSEQRAAWDRPSIAGWGAGRREIHPVLLGLERERSDLYGRIDRRVDAMFDAGLVDETRALIRAGLLENPTASQAIGYRQVIEYLDGARSLEATIALVKQRTRHYAKRQMTWFRHQADLQWIRLSPSETAEETARRLEQALP